MDTEQLWEEMWFVKSKFNQLIGFIKAGPLTSEGAKRIKEFAAECEEAVTKWKPEKKAK